MLWTGVGTDILIGVLSLSLILVVGTMLFLRLQLGQESVRKASLRASIVPETRLENLSVLVVDLETTGLDVRRDRIVSIGAVPALGTHIDHDNVLDLLVHPDCPVPPRSTAIHGITDAMVADAPFFIEVFEELDAMLSDRVVVGHNIGFDLAVLRSECKRLGLNWKRPAALDLVRLAAALDPRERDLTLEGMAARWSIAVTGRHTALGDALMTAEMWAHVVPLLHDAGVVTLGDALIFERRARAVIANQKRAGW